MQQTFALFLLLVGAVQVCLSVTTASDVVTENLKLYVGGSEYFIKAICYSPVPLGAGVRQANGDVGGGYCSNKVSPFGNTVTTCYDSDFFDGSANADGKPSPPEGGWFQSTWARDFPIMKSMGANTLRLYSTNPTTRQASIYFPDVVQLALGKDHVPFMDMAQQYGFKVIFPLISDYGMMTQYTEVQFKRLLRWQIDELGNHPALLMWAFGNELPLNGNPSLVSKMNGYMAFIRQYTYAKWGRRVPVTCAVVDDPSSYDYLAAALDVDIFTTNAGYRGVSLTDLWTGNAITQGWAKLSCRYNKPLFIGEINWHSLNNAISYEIPNWFNQIWQDVVNNIDKGCIGGAFFEYSDEPLKEDPLQRTMGAVSFSINTTGAGTSTQQNVWNLDIATRKDIVYNQLASGSVNGVFYNMNSSPYYLIGRPQSKLGASSSVCGAYNFRQCPAANTCSYNGLCDGTTGTCKCNAGWTGSDCSQPTCSNGCNGRGQCVTTVSPPVCSCSSGWTGADCSVQLTQANCDSYCAAGNGKCTSGVCTCFKGWQGNDCSIPDTSYPPTAGVPTTAATNGPTRTPTSAPTVAATKTPTAVPTAAATTVKAATNAPTSVPTAAATTKTPTSVPTAAATTKTPTAVPTGAATTKAPTAVPTKAATVAPTAAATIVPTTAPAQNNSCFVQCGTGLACCGYACYTAGSYGCAGNQLCQIGQPGCTGGATTATTAPTNSPSLAPTSSPTTVKAVPTTVATTVPTAAATSSPTTVKAAATTAPTTTTTQQANNACGTLASCGLACYNPQTYTCFDGFLCTNPTKRCGNTCYDADRYTCNNGQIV